MAELVHRGELGAPTERILLGRLSTLVVLGAIVTVASCIHTAFALRSPSPWIIPDELIYSELAKSLAHGDLPTVRADTSLAYGLGYPALLAPIWAIFGEVQTAYAVAKVMNALVLSLTAVPAFLLARKFLGWTHSMLVAALAVGVPSMLYTGTLLTEVALYPAFVLALFAIATAIELPRPRTQLAALGAIALACTVKVLALVLVPSLVLGIVIYHWLDTRELPVWRTRLQAYWPLWSVLGGALVLAFVVPLALGRSPLAIFGIYSVVAGNIEFTAIPWWALLHLAELDLYLAVIPFAATLALVLGGLRRSSVERWRLFASLVLPIVTVLVLTLGAYSSKPHAGAAGFSASSARLHERALFFVAPLLLVGCFLLLTASPGVVRRTPVVVGATVAALLPVVIPLEEFELAIVRFQAIALVPWIALSDDLPWRLGALVLTALLASIFMFSVRARRGSAVVAIAIGMVFALVSIVAADSMREASKWTRSVAYGDSAGWIDAAVGRERSVAVLWAEPPGRDFVDLAPRHRIVFVGEFFNRSIGDVYEIGSPLPYGLPSTPVRLDGGRVVLIDGSPAELGSLVLAPCHVSVDGAVVAHDATTGATIYRVVSPVRATVAHPDSCAGT